MRNPKWIITAAVVLAIGTIAVVYLKAPEVLPQNLVGRWTCDDPRYEDRFLELAPKTVVIGTGGIQIDVYFITSVKARRLPHDRTYYTVKCRNAHNDAHNFAFVYKAHKNGQIQFKHQKVIWEKGNRSVSK